ncbi:MAG: 4Fe-4S binding protein [Sedimentisphaerales bacterium]|nr:4Fe-4S binding protein [Sedimentisphaerales bacterium]
MLITTSRKIVQVISATLTNSYIGSLFTGTIYQGPLKGFCVPALNCYACPLAVSACPIGSIQHFVAHGAYHITLYAVGIITLVGAAVGRMACGWVCPFGLLQDLLFKVPSRKLTLPRAFSYGKYLALVLLVFIIPLIYKQTWFCKLCPAGGIEGGLPMLALDPTLRDLIGTMFTVKMLTVILFIVSAILVKRAFCRTACPLGALFSFFNRVSLFRISVDQDACIECDKCRQACPTDIKIYENPDDADCIRCLECKPACPVNAISYGLRNAALTQQKETFENA